MTKSTRKATAGFTLLEILIVVVVLGALASLAIPVYTTTTERARKQEALSFLSAIRDSQQRYFIGYSEYAEEFGQLDFDPTATMAGQTPLFEYSMERLSEEEWTATASRTGNEDLPGGDYTVVINEMGQIVSNF